MAQRAAIICIGAGRMGRGIAQCAAYAGHPVRLIDARARDGAGFAALREAALTEVAAGLGDLAALGAFDAGLLPRLVSRVSVHPLAEAEDVLGAAGIVFEAVPETREAKQGAFALFDRAAGQGAILASTTSTMLATELAGFTARPGNFLNAHWLNPALLMPLVELSPAAETAPETIERLRAFLESIGKVTVTCRAAPGFIVPRIQALAMNEAARLVEEGVASAEDVDKAVRYGFGLRFSVLGLLEFIDWGGGDILYHASRYMAEATGETRFAPPAIVERNMAEGRIGLSTRQGFLDYSDLDLAAYRRERMAAFLDRLRGAGLARAPVP